jgi:hypothetical protein
MTAEMPVVGGILSASKEVRNWMGFLKRRNDTDRKEYRESLSAIYFAANETIQYLATQRKTTRRNLKQERGLAALWTSAGLSLESLDADLAQRCIRKGQYWSDPEAWTTSAVKRARIDLDRIQREARFLLVRLATR